MVVVDAAEVDPAFDARFSARGKVYRYRIWNHFTRSAKYHRAAWHFRPVLDLEVMRAAAAALCGEHDFRGASVRPTATGATPCASFAGSRSRARAPWWTSRSRRPPFLKNMVRILAGTLADVGRGKLDQATVEEVLTTGDWTRGGVTAPPQGLTLVRVIY